MNICLCGLFGDRVALVKVLVNELAKALRPDSGFL
jgi:hypothetical protein